MTLISSILIAPVNFGKAQTGTTVSGFIANDTTWTKANSPYTLVGNILIDNGVTLKIEAGVVVNLNSYNLMINGTLSMADATVNRAVRDFGAQLIFKSGSTGWDPQSGSGCMISNSAIRVTIRIEDASPLISFCDIAASLDDIVIVGGSPIFSNNNIRGMGYTDSAGWPTVTEVGIVLSDFNHAIITDNVISGFSVACIRGSGSPLIQRNLFTNSVIGVSSSSASILNNTFLYCGNAIEDSSLSDILYNNFENNSYSIYCGSTNMNVSNNWWGTIDVQAINQSIYDFKNDFNMGKVTFVPFLAEPNPQAMPDSNAPLPTSSPVQTTPTETQTSNTPVLLSPTLTASPTIEPSIPEFPTELSLLLIALIVAIAIVVIKRNG